MTAAPSDPVAALADQQAELATILDSLDDQAWRRPSPCAGWDVADVVLHLAQTNEMAVASLEGRLGEFMAELGEGLGPAADVDEAAALTVAKERAIGPAAIHDRWHASSAALRAAVARADLAARVQWVAGELSARTLVTTRLAETWIHTGDVAEAVGVELAPTDRLWHIARLAWRTLPYAFAQAGRELSGPVAFELRGPGGDTWSFVDGEPTTMITGDAAELCRVAARRIDPSSTSLASSGPDGDGVLQLVRTYA